MRVISAADLQRTATQPQVDGANHALRLQFAGLVAELRTGEAALVEELRAKYRYHVTRKPADFTYFVTAGRAGYAFWCAHAGGWQWNAGGLPADALAFLADAALMSAVVHVTSDVQSAHAAAVASGGAGAIIAGDSTAGKTTTLLACARAGLQIFSDERALMRGGLLFPFARRCSVRPGGRKALLADDQGDSLAAALQESSEIDLVRCFGETAIASPAPVKVVFIIKHRGTSALAEVIDAAQALPAVARWFDTRGDAMDRLAAANALLRSAACYALTLGTPRQSAHLIRDLIERTP